MVSCPSVVSRICTVAMRSPRCQVCTLTLARTEAISCQPKDGMSSGKDRKCPQRCSCAVDQPADPIVAIADQQRLFDVHRRVGGNRMSGTG